MKAVCIPRHGGPEVLTYGNLPDPVPAPGEALVRVRACGVNHTDLSIRQGALPKVPLPFVPGIDIAGEVTQSDGAAGSLPPGTRVVVNPGVGCGRCERCLSGRDNLCADYRLIGEHLPGGYAELVRVPIQNLVPVPAEIPLEIAACLPAVYTTAWNMLFDQAAIQPGEWVLIHAGGSGVGSAAIQLARLVGANVITTAGDDAKVDKAKALGAHHGINYKTHDFLHEVRRITGKRGVDVVVEHIGDQVFERSLLCLTIGGRLVTCGATAGHLPKTNLRHVFFRNLRILGATTASKARLFRIVQLVGEGKFRPVVDRVLPLAQAQEAHRVLEGRQQFGKVILVPEANA